MSGDAAPLRLAAVSGSLRQSSYNRRLLEVAMGLALDYPVQWQWVDGLQHVPTFNEDQEFPTPPAVALLRSTLADSDAVLVATPEYNASIPGALKNALDWLSRSDDASAPSNIQASSFFGKPVSVVSASTGQFGAAWAAAELRKVLGTQGARVVSGDEVAVPTAKGAFRPDGGLVSPDLERRLHSLVSELVRVAARLREVRAAAQATAAGVHAAT